MNIQTGLSFLVQQSTQGKFHSYIGENRTSGSKLMPQEVFPSIIIGDILTEIKNNPLNSEILNKLLNEILTYINKNINKDGLLHFFENRSIYPADSDDTSLGLSLLHTNKLLDDQKLQEGFNKILEFNSKENIIQTWLDEKRKNHIDAVVCTNVLYTSLIINESEKLKETINFIINQLETNKYLDGTRYYPSPDFLLYFLSRNINFKNFDNKLKDLLNIKIKERDGQSNFPLDILMRNIIAKKLGIKNKKDLELLKELKPEPANNFDIYDSLYGYGTNKLYIGNKTIPMALLIQNILTN